MAKKPPGTSKQTLKSLQPSNHSKNLFPFLTLTLTHTHTQNKINEKYRSSFELRKDGCRERERERSERNERVVKRKKEKSFTSTLIVY